MFVLGHPGAPGLPDQSKALQLPERVADIALGVRGDRRARGLLIAGVAQRVQGQRVVVGRGLLFLDKAAQYANLQGG